LEEEARSPIRFIRSGLDLKSWMKCVPTVDAARPGQCPGCAAASRPLGEKVIVVGHGLRERQLRGPAEPAAVARIERVKLRRYRCRRCRTVMVVGPRELVAGRLYSAGAVGWALALYGLCSESLASIRRRVSPWSVIGATAAASWATLRRWVRAVRDGKLFAVMRPAPVEFSARQVAERAATTLLAYAPSSTAALPLDHQSFIGAAHALMHISP
jgi:hypothetical protein